MTSSFYHDDDDRYAWADPTLQDRQMRRKRTPKANHAPKKSQKAILTEIAETRDLEGDFEMTYRPSLFEGDWLMASLRPLFEMAYITDVIARVKGGKEASVYRCQPHSNTGETLLAVKVYRPRMFRNLRNDALYREGREIIGQDGKAIKENETRALRAIHKHSAFGQQIRHTSWLTHEYKTLQRLYEAGADVPKPFAVADNVILMSYIGDEQSTAPTLSETRLSRVEAQRLFEQVMRNVELMLSLGVIHGDLSAFNVLYWEGELTIIDFPQVVDPHINHSARFIFERDVVRLCEYFERQGVKCDGKKWAKKLWVQTMGDYAPIDYQLHDDAE